MGFEARPTTAKVVGPPRYAPISTKRAAALPKAWKTRLFGSLIGTLVVLVEYFWSDKDREETLLEAVIKEAEQGRVVERRFW